MINLNLKRELKAQRLFKKHVVIGGGPSGVIYALKVKKDYLMIR